MIIIPKEGFKIMYFAMVECKTIKKKYLNDNIAHCQLETIGMWQKVLLIGPRRMLKMDLNI